MKFVSKTVTTVYEAKFDVDGRRKTYEVIFDEGVSGICEEVMVKVERRHFRVFIPKERIANLIEDACRVIDHFEKSCEYPTEKDLYEVLEDAIETLAVLYNGTFDVDCACREENSDD